MASGAENSVGGPAFEIDRVIHEPARLILTAHLYVVDSADYVFLMQNLSLIHI